MEKEKIEELPETPEEPSPNITPEMIQTTFKALESKGMILYSEGGVYIPTERGWKLLMQIKPMKEEITAYGHTKILATDTTATTITKSNIPKKDVIAVRADKACSDLSKEFKHLLKEAVKVEITIEAGNIKDKVTAYGSPALKLTHQEDITIRKNDFIDNRTLAILADKAANELKQELIEKLRNENTKVKITLEVKK